MDGKGPPKKKASPKPTPRDGPGGAKKKVVKKKEGGGTTPRPSKADGGVPPLANPLGGSSSSFAAKSSSSTGAELESELETAEANQLRADQALLERLQSIIGPLKVAAEVEQAQQAAEAALQHAQAALTSAQPAAARPSGGSLFARWVNRAPPPAGGSSSSSSSAAPAPVVLLDPLGAHWRRLFIEAQAEIDQLTKERRDKKEGGVSFGGGGAGGAPAGGRAPPSFANAQKMLGVSANILRIEKGEADDSLRRREMRGEGLTLPKGWAETAASRLRPGAAAAVFADVREASIKKKEEKKSTSSWAATLSLAAAAVEHASIGGSARVSDPEYASIGQAAASGGGGGGKLKKKSLKRAAKLWAKVAKMALPGRWSPRPEEEGSHTHTAHHVRKGVDGYPTLADPHGLLGEEEEEEEEEYEEDEYVEGEEIANVELADNAEAETLARLQEEDEDEEGGGGSVSYEKPVEGSTEGYAPPPPPPPPPPEKEEAVE